MQKNPRCYDHRDRPCIHCNQHVRQDAQGSWIDATDGDGCDNPSGVHQAVAPKACRVCNRIGIEADIVTRVVDALLAKGFFLNVDNGGDEAELPKPVNATERDALLAVLMETDDEYLNVYAFHDPTKEVGWIQFVYGNDGYDVISDYTTNLEDVLRPVNDYVATARWLP